MSKQAWRFVLKKEQKHKRKKERKRAREREKTKRREEKVRGTAQESFSHEAQKTTKTMPITTYSKDSAVNTPPHTPLLPSDTQKQYTDLRR